jgi:PAS domain S-box-containing protein
VTHRETWTVRRSLLGLKRVTDSRKLRKELGAASKVASGITIAVAAAALMARMVRLGPDTDLSFGLPAITPSTALCLLLAGCALGLHSVRFPGRATRVLSIVMAAVVACVASITLIQLLIGRNLFVDWLSTGRAATSVCLLLAGFALVFMDFKTASGTRPADHLSWAMFLVALFALLSTGSVTDSFAAYQDVHLGLYGALTLVVLSAGILCVRPSGGLIGLAIEDSEAGSIARRLLLAAVVGPMVAGLLVVLGERAGGYDSQFAIGLLVSLNVLIILVVVWRSFNLLHAAAMAANPAQRSSSEVVDSMANGSPVGGSAHQWNGDSDLRIRSDELEDFFENAAVALQWVGPDGVIIRANRAELELLGYSSQEYVGHHISKFHVDKEVISDMLERLSRGETLNNWEARLRTKNGSIKRVLIDSNVLWRGDHFVHSRCFTRDITDLKRIEEARCQLLISEQAARAQAEESAEMVRRLQNIVDFSLIRLPLPNLLDELLERVRELLRADAAAVLLQSSEGRGLVPHTVVGPEGAVTQELKAAKGHGIALRIAASRAPLLIPDLTGIDVVGTSLFDSIRSLMGAPLMIEGDIIGVIYAVSANINHFSENDLPSLQLVADRVALAIEHARLYEAEQGARLSAEAANRMKDEFLATVSHELRSPLNAVLGWMKLLRAGRLDEEASAHALETIERSAKTQNRIINDLLDVSRIISGKLLLKVRPIEPVRIIQAAIEAVRPAADAKGIELKNSLDPAAGPLSGDADRLQQIVWNLLSNAIKFTPSGGVVEVMLERKERQAQIVVRDSGIGISPDFLPYVFDRFRQADASSSRRQGGLGLGLAIVRHLVELHGGTVAVRSDGEGTGSNFIVMLPRAIGSDGNLEGARVRRRSGEFPGFVAPQLDGLRVLLVDDDSDARELMTVILTQANANVRVAASAAEALEILTRQSEWAAEVLVSDIEMPGTDGYTLIRQVRALEAERKHKIPAVAVTAYSRVEDRMRALAAGFQLHIAKPVEPGELLTVLSSLTGRSSKTRWSNASTAQQGF